MKLSLVIPTLNRAKELNKTFQYLNQAIAISGSKEIEIIVGDNLSTDDTKKIVEYWQDRLPIKYFKHPIFLNTAEESLYSTLKHASGEYVWTMGDDDEPLADCLETLLKSIETYSPDYICLNTDYRLPDGRIIQQHRSENILYNFGKDLFKNFGLCQMTCAFYACVFKKEFLNETLFKELYEISPIYSHIFSLFASFAYKKALFLNKVLIIGTANMPEDENLRIQNATKSKNQYRYFSGTVGLLALIKKVSEVTKISHDEILSFQELVVDKKNWILNQMSLKKFILMIFEEQINELKIAANKGRFFKLSKRKIPSIKKFYEEILVLCPNFF